ncbi:MAG: BLUF domain-containing protein [Amaricoccus sp.]
MTASRGGCCTIATAHRRLERNLIQLVYASVAAPALTSEDLEDIASRSAARNAAAGVTGLLLHQGDRFYGVMEGPEARVFQRMEAIITDRRHAEVRILREEPIGERRFENWSFGELPALGLPGAGGPPSPEAFVLALSRRRP